MASRFASRSLTERAPSLHGRGRDIREHRLGLEPRIGVAAVSAIVRTWIDSLKPGTPGRSEHMPRTMRSMGTPAWLAR